MSQIPGKFLQDLSINTLKLSQSGASLGNALVWNGTQWAPGVPGGLTILETTTTQTSTSTTHAAITELTSTSLPIGTYEVTMYGIAQSTATATGIGFRLNSVTATMGTLVILWEVGQGGNGTDKYYQYEQTTTTITTSSASAAAANADFLVRCTGYFKISNAGTVAIEFRSETGTAVSIRANSMVLIKRIA